MTIYYVRSTTGSSGNDGLSWATAKALLSQAAALAVAGDFIYVSQAHIEANAATLILTFAGTLTNPVRVLGVNDSTGALQAGNSISTTGAFYMRIIGHGYFEKLKLISNIAGTVSSASLLLNYSGGARQVYKDCDLWVADTHALSTLQIGSAVNNDISDTLIEDCRLKIGIATQSISMHWNVRIVGGGMAAGSATSSAGLFGSSVTTAGTTAVVENFDLSGLTAGVHLMNVPPAGNESGSFEFINCKLPASWSGNLVAATFVNVNWRASMVNCDSGDTNYRNASESNIGYAKSETTYVKTGGSAFGSVPLALKMETRATANEVVSVLRSQPIVRWGDTEGVAKTLTVDVLHDSVTALTDADIWLELEYLGTSGSTLGVRASNRRANLFASSASHAASSASWAAGLTNPNKQKLVLPFTPQEKGYYTARVCLGKPSTVVYADLDLQVA